MRQIFRPSSPTEKNLTYAGSSLISGCRSAHPSVEEVTLKEGALYDCIEEKRKRKNEEEPKTIERYFIEFK